MVPIVCSRGASRALNFLLVWQHTPSLVASVASCNLRTIHTTRTARCRCSQAHFPGLNPLSSNPSPVSVCNRRLCPPPGIRPRSPQVAYPMALRIVPTTPRPQRQLGSRINRTPGRQPGDAMSSHMIRSLIQRDPISRLTLRRTEHTATQSTQNKSWRGRGDVTSAQPRWSLWPQRRPPV